MRSSIIGFTIAIAFMLLLSVSVIASGYDVGGSVGIYIKVTNDTSELGDNPTPDVLPGDNSAHHHTSDDTEDTTDQDYEDQNPADDNADNEAVVDQNDEKKSASVSYRTYVEAGESYKTDDSYVYTGEDIVFEAFVKSEDLGLIKLKAGSTESICKEEISPLNVGEIMPDTFSDQVEYDDLMRFFVCKIKTDETMTGMIDAVLEVEGKDSSLLAQKRKEFLANIPLTVEITPGSDKLFVQNSQPTPLKIIQSCNNRFMIIGSSAYKNVKLDDCKGNYIIGTVL